MKIREINPFGLRLPPDLKQELVRQARANHRSLNAEIVSRLQSHMTVGPPVLSAQEIAAPRYGELLNDHERAMLEVFRGMSAERQLALLSLLK